MIKYDNCKDCKANCEHAGKNREFVCMNGVSCKVAYTQDEQKKTATEFINAIKTIAEKPDNLANFESYLSSHFLEWVKRYTNTPEDLTAEMKAFAEMEI